MTPSFASRRWSHFFLPPTRDPCAPISPSPSVLLIVLYKQCRYQLFSAGMNSTCMRIPSQQLVDSGEHRHLAPVAAAVRFLSQVQIQLLSSARVGESQHMKGREACARELGCTVADQCVSFVHHPKFLGGHERLIPELEDSSFNVLIQLLLEGARAPCSSPWLHTESVRFNPWRLAGGPAGPPSPLGVVHKPRDLW